MKLVMLGAPGAGKGSQADRLADRFGLLHLSTGDLFRAHLSAGTKLGQRAKEFMESGRLVPDDVTEGMVWDKLEGVTGGYILDGFPRTVPQGAHLDEFLNGRGEQLTRVIHVWVKPEVIVDRLSGRRSCPDCKATYHVSLNPPKVAGVCDVCGSALVQRSDDEADTIQKRLEVYQQETAPLIAFYEARGLIFTVDGNQSMAQVAEAIAEGLVGGDPA